MRDIKKGGKKQKDKKNQKKTDAPDDMPDEVKTLYEKYANAKQKKPAKSKTSEPDTEQTEGEEQDESKPAKEQSSKSSRLEGDSVPVTNVHVPDEEDAEEDEEDESSAEVEPANVPEAKDTQSSTRAKKRESKLKKAQEEERPLFANVPKKKKKRSGQVEKGTDMRKKKRPSMRVGSKERNILIALGLLAVLGAGLAVYIFLPSASVELVLASEPLLVDREFTVGGSDGEKQIAGQVYTDTVEVQGNAPVTGTTVVGEKATGTVRIINRTTQEQPIKNESRLVTEDGKLYFMQSHAIVPPAEGGQPSSKTVRVEAAEAGEEFNIDTQRLDFKALDESARQLVYAEVVNSISGGSGEEKQLVSEDDIETARQQAKDEAKEELRDTATSDLNNKDGWEILEESWDIELSSFTAEVEPGDDAQEVPYSASARVRVLAFDRTSLESQLRTSLEPEIKDGRMLFPGPISFTKSLDDVNWDAGRGTITARVTHSTVADIDKQQLKEDLAARSRSEAVEYLTGREGIKSAQISLEPFWASNIPRISDRVTVEFVSNEQP